MPMRILVVDDAPEIRQLLRTALRFHGAFRVVGEAADGRAAIGAAARTQPDLVVLDLGLPDLEGREVMTGLRAKAPRAKVVLYTGRDTSEAKLIAEDVEGLVMKDADLDHLVAILAQMADSTGPWQRLDLPDDPAAVARARRLVGDVCAAGGRPDLVHEASLVASELVANAIVHARGGCEVHVRCTGPAVRIEVLDAGPGTPDPRHAGDADERGRGLHIVAALSFAWGVEAAEGGRKAVWAELA